MTDVVDNPWPYWLAIGLTWFLFACLLAQHLLHIRNVKFQGILLRIVMIFPLSSMTLFGLSQKGYALLGNFTVAVLLGYIFLAFFGAMCGWGFMKGDVYASLLSSTPTKHMFALWGWGFGPQFASGRKALNNLWLQTLQMCFVKPINLLAKYAIIENASMSLEGKQAISISFAVVNFLSLFMASMAIVRLYRALKGKHFAKSTAPASDEEEASGDEDHTEVPPNLLKGLNPFRKFQTIKLLMFCLAINGLVLPLMIPSVAGIPGWICGDISPNCIQMYMSFIFSVQCLFLSLPALLCFHSRRNLRQEGYVSQFETNTSRCRKVGGVIWNFFMFFDVLYSMTMPVENPVPETEMIKSKPPALSVDIDPADDPEVAETREGAFGIPVR